jgi:hypothetical protein
MSQSNAPSVEVTRGVTITMPRNACARRLAFAVIASAIAAIVGISPPTASAYVHTAEPIVQTACWATACPGGDGVAFVELLNGNYSWGSLGPLQKPLIELEQAAEVLPKPQWVPALNTVVLGATAFAVGWKIGTTLNTKWLHIAGVGLGTFETQSALKNVKWSRLEAGASCTQALGAGYYLHWYDGTNWNCGATDPNSGTNCPTPSTFSQQRWANYLSMVASTPGETAINGTSGCGAASYVFKKTPAQYDDAFEMDQALQALIGQAFGIWTGWADPASGAGISKTAPNYGSGPTNPQPQAGPAQTTADGLPDGDRNGVNCRLDHSYDCPTASPDGTTWTDPGGKTFVLPAPLGTETYDAYIGRLQTLGLVGSANVTTLGADDGDSEFIASGVPCTVPAQGARIRITSQVTLYANPAVFGSADSGPGPTCGGRLATSKTSNRCSFHDRRWDEVYAANPTYYQQACDDAWAYFWAHQMMIDADGNVLDETQLHTMYVGAQIEDPEAVARLTADGSTMAQYEKAATDSFAAPHPFHLHLYWNPTTNKIRFDTDFKLRFNTLFEP